MGNSTPPRRKKLVSRGDGLILLVLMAIGLYFYWGSHPDPRITLDKLRGLTPDEVAARLGPPRFTGREGQFHAWTPSTIPSTGPFDFGYHSRFRWRGFEYVVRFEDNHVVDVRIGSK